MPIPRIAIIGLGYFGPNWLRNFAALDSCTVAMACDKDPARVKKYERAYPSVRFATNADQVMQDTEVDAVVIATPPETHAELAERALGAGKHVLIEKPMTTSHADAQRITKLATEKNLTLLVDHTFAFTDAVEKMRELVHDGTVGDILYIDSQRMNLGLIQQNANVLWDLAIHDLTIIGALQDLSTLTSVRAVGHRHFGDQIEDAHLHLDFASGIHAHVHVSWLSPVKLRQTLVGGTKTMLVYDDTQPSEKIRIYDKGIEHDATKADPFFPKYRAGDVLLPALGNAEALGKIARHFVACIQGNETPRVGGEDGTRMVKILECADTSMRSGNAIPLSQ